MFPEPVPFPSSAELRSIFSKVNPQIDGSCIIIGLARSNKHTVKKEEFSGENLIS